VSSSELSNAQNNRSVASETFVVGSSASTSVATELADDAEDDVRESKLAPVDECESPGRFRGSLATQSDGAARDRPSTLKPAMTGAETERDHQDLRLPARDCGSARRVES